MLSNTTKWPTSADEVGRVQSRLATTAPEPWDSRTGGETVGGVFVCFGRGGSGPGEQGDPGWAAAALMREGRFRAGVEVTGVAGGPYRSGYLAIREGPLLERAVRALGESPEVLLVNATGRDHPRRAGLALHLGAVLGIPTVGVTHRPLLASGEWPRSGIQGATAPLSLGEEMVGLWLRTQADCRPVVVHAGWRTSVETARFVVLATVAASRTPEPLREARRLARTARSQHPAAR